MSEEQIPSPDSDVTFESGIAIGQEEGFDDAVEQLIDDGVIDESEAEALYDPPKWRRKSRGRSRSRSQPGSRSRRGRGKKTWHMSGSSRAYDPINIFQGGKRGGGHKKGGWGKLKGLVFPVTVLGLTYMDYAARGKTLKAQGKIPSDSVFEAIKYDIKNFKSEDAIKRLQDNAGSILIPAGAGVAAKALKGYAPAKTRGIVDVIGDVLLGIGSERAIKSILDPPIDEDTTGTNGNGSSSPNGAVIVVSQDTTPSPEPAQIEIQENNNPYAGVY